LGRWVYADEMRSKMRDVGLQKVPGYSWFEVQNKIHTFSVGLFPSREREKIGFLEELDLKMRERGMFLQ